MPEDGVAWLEVPDEIERLGCCDPCLERIQLRSCVNPTKSRIEKCLLEKEENTRDTEVPLS